MTRRKCRNVAKENAVDRAVLAKRTLLPWPAVANGAATDRAHAVDVIAGNDRARQISLLIGVLQTMMDESSDPETAKGFNAAMWLEGWLSQPNPALGNVAPSTYLGTEDGWKVLRTLLSQFQSGAYA